jgi:hypothetical protein
MSAPNEGMHLAREAQSFTEKMRDNLVTGDVQRQGTQGGAIPAQLPRKVVAFDRMDDEMNTKMQMMDDKGMTPFGQVYYDDKVGRWLERKAAAVETANLDAWFNKEFNKPNLADRQFAQQIYPEFYREREKLMMERAQEVLKLKMIQLRGPQSKEDMYKLWMLNTGRVELPDDWDRIGSDGGQVGNTDAQQRNFRSGLVRLPLFDSAGTRSQGPDTRFGDTTARNTPFYQASQTSNASNPFYVPTTENTSARQFRPLQSGGGTFGQRFVGGLRQQ